MTITERLSRWVRKRFLGWFTITRVVGLLLLVGAAFLVYQKYGLDWTLIEEHLFDNVVTDVTGIVFAILVLDTVSEGRAKRERKRAIMQQMGSPVNDAALEASRIASIESWLEDGSLKRVRLWGANLEGAHLQHANLEGANLGIANLEGAHLERANLKGAWLGSANLKRAWLDSVNLEGADLVGAQLQLASLRDANLKGAVLNRSFLQGTYLTGAKLRAAHHLDSALFDETTILPDKSKWTPDTDMARFTDPEHKDFFSPKRIYHVTKDS